MGEDMKIERKREGHGELERGRVRDGGRGHVR